MAGFRSVTPSINVNTESGQLRTELFNTFTRLDGQLSLVPFRLDAFSGPAGNAAGSETTLDSTTVSIGTLAKSESSILIFACGKTGSNANTKSIKLRFGNVILFDTGSVAMNNEDWTLQAEIVRTSDVSQIAWIQFFGGATLPSKVTVTTSSINLAENQTITISGQGTNASDVTLYYVKSLLLT
jgi:hypothetical protein